MYIHIIGIISCQYPSLYFLGLRQSNFNGDPNVKRTCLPTGRMAQCRMQIEKRKIAFCQIGTLARLHVRTLARCKWELEIGNWEFLFSVSRFPFLLYARLQSCKLTRWNWEMGISIFCFLFSVSRFPFLLFLLYAR